MPARKHRSLPYRPALDGLRAVAVMAVVIYHVDGHLMRGGWLGVDLFFVLSGFLITSLLLSEFHQWGSISLGRFWLARARRLLPGLIPMLLAVVIASAFLAAPGRRPAIAHDVLAALFYVANWRFLLGDEQYFAQIAMPSPVRHTWSLAIEEQYYILFPLLLTVLLMFVRKRRSLASVLLVMAAASAAWMTHLYVPGVDPSRVYYGTDTRAFELLIGAAAGTLLGRHDFHDRGRLRVDRWVTPVAWGVIALMVVAFFTVSEQDAWLFQGGLVVFAVAAAAPIAAAAAPGRSHFQRFFGAEAMRQVGLLSYSLYLWHWPVIVFLPATRTNLPSMLNGLLQIVVSFALAWLSLTYLERPVRTRGFTHWLPRHNSLSRLAALGALPAVVVGSLWLPSVTAEGASQGGGGGTATLAQPAYVPAASKSAITIIGNSIPASLYEALPSSTYPDLDISESVSFGCDPFDGAKLLDGTPQEPSAACAQWRHEWPQDLKSHGTKLAVLFIPQSLVSDWRVNGKVLTFDTPAWRAWLESTLDSIRVTTTSHGAQRFAVMNLACHDLPKVTSEMKLIDDESRVDRLDALVAHWASGHKVPVIDQHSALCSGGFHGKVNGVPLYKDGLHFSDKSGAIMWRWLAPQLQELVK